MLVIASLDLVHFLYTDIEIGHINYSDTNIGRMEIATIVNLARGCSLTQRELGAMLRFHQTAAAPDIERTWPACKVRLPANDLELSSVARFLNQSS